VTWIGDHAFYKNQLTSVAIPANVTTIYDGAFRENNLTSITIPSSVTSIREAAFSQNRLTSVIIPSSVASIGNSVFQDNQLVSVTIPANITAIGDQAFYKNQLTSVVIPGSVTSIGKNAFRENQLASITIPNSVVSIGEWAFSQNRLTSVTMGNSVTAIGEGVFRDNRLTSVVIPNSVTSIEGYAFNGNNLWTITIGDNVTFPSSGVEVFGTLGFLTAYNNNDKLAGIYTRSGANSTNWSWATPFQWTQAGNRITITGHIGSGGVMILPAAINGIPVTAVGNGAFRDKNLTKVVIPDGVTSIGTGAFAGNRLTSVALGANVTFGSDALDSDLESAYSSNSMTAGTYTRPDAASTAWAAVPVPGGFVRLPGGTFTMGSPANEPGRDNDEGPQRQITVSAFYRGQNPVTVGEFRRFASAAGYRTEAESEGDGQVWTGSSWETRAKVNWKNPGFTQGQDYPVVLVSWNDAVRYCNWLSQQEGLTPAYYYTVNKDNRVIGVTRNRNASGYRLPTEAEWEYACRAGTRTPFNTGNNITTDQANYHGANPYNDNAQGAYRERTTPVRSFEPNAWGLYDMHGNVYEWCWDWYGSYSATVQTDPAGPVSGERRATRGGSWNTAAQNLRSAYRGTSVSSDRNNGRGFRVVRP
jgi:formylglycine-generating enzyme required for sulfatase activity